LQIRRRTSLTARLLRRIISLLNRLALTIDCRSVRLLSENYWKQIEKHVRFGKCGARSNARQLCPISLRYNDLASRQAYQSERPWEPGVAGSSPAGRALLIRTYVDSSFCSSRLVSEKSVHNTSKRSPFKQIARVH
jgi:hypothetical protein